MTSAKKGKILNKEPGIAKPYNTGKKKRNAAGHCREKDNPLSGLFMKALELRSMVYNMISDFKGALSDNKAIIEGGFPAREQAAAHLRTSTILFKMGNSIGSLAEAEKAIAIGRRTGLTEFIVSGHTAFARASWREGRYEEALGFLKKAKDLLRNIGPDDRERLEGFIMHTEALILCSYGKFNEAEKVFQKNLNILLKNKELPNQASVMYNLGSIRESVGDWDGALKYYDEAGRLYDRIGDISGKGDLLLNRGKILSLQFRHKEALKLLKEALSIYGDTGEPEGISHTQLAIGLQYKSLGDIEQAVNYLEKSLETASAIGEMTLIVSSLVNLLNIRLDSGDTEICLSYFKKGEEYRSYIEKNTFLFIHYLSVKAKYLKISGDRDGAVAIFDKIIDRARERRMWEEYFSFYASLAELISEGPPAGGYDNMKIITKLEGCLTEISQGEMEYFLPQIYPVLIDVLFKERMIGIAERRIKEFREYASKTGSADIMARVEGFEKRLKKENT